MEPPSSCTAAVSSPSRISYLNQFSARQCWHDASNLPSPTPRRRRPLRPHRSQGVISIANISSLYVRAGRDQSTARVYMRERD
jgi:hypothetical protein